MKTKENKGITLIALVVTIIVLLILAGVSITMLTGQNGILNRAREAKEKTEVAQIQENTTINNYGKTIDKYIQNLPSTEYTTPYLPDATKFEIVDGTNLENGLVVREKITQSEYVWVEVPKTNTIYSSAGLNITSFTENEYIKIEEDLHKYTENYRKDTSYTDTYCNDNTTGWFKNEKQYNDLKKEMLKSVYQNGGFWVGRYEAGYEIDESKNEKTRYNGSDNYSEIPTNQQVKTKKNLYPYNWIRRNQAKMLAEKVESGKYTSSLMFGVQWDLMLKFLETKGVVAEEKLKSDSTTIGNYKENLWNVTNKLAKYSTDLGNTFLECPYKKEKAEGALLTTGADEKFSLMNIFDIAGNVWEWTLENTSNSDNFCTYEGGYYGNSGAVYQASFRGKSSTTYSGSNIGFRIAIY